jgi:myosin heavy chain 9/10/11/14
VHSLARRALADAEKVQTEAIADRSALEERLKSTEARMHDLEAKLEEEGRESADMELLRQRLREEMEDARKQHQQDLAERDFTADQTRKKYQSKSSDFWTAASPSNNSLSNSRACTAI